MLNKEIEIKEGIKFHEIETNKFKTNLFAIFLSLPVTRENVTKNALLTAILRRGTKQLPTQELISKTLEEMYGAGFDCGIEKSGDYHTIKFYLETINDEFEVVEESDEQVKIRFNHDKYTIMDIVNRISNYCEITDMHIEEQGLEEILKEIYRGEITC